MLSISKIRSASSASSYFSKENYYTKDSPEAERESSWFGAGAVTLGLSGVVSQEQFSELLHGNLPDGSQLGRTGEGGKREHVPGWDLTFSAPKSVSILAEVGGDQRLIDAHKAAVNKAMEYLEANAARTRIRDGKGVVSQATEKFVVAQFHHDTSRDLDPQTHTHNVVLNITQHNDGQWRSVDSKPIFDRKMLGGAIYRAELAYRVKQLGYAITKTHSDGRFEITSVPTQVIEGFSKRRAVIAAELERRGKDDARTAANVAAVTRERKTDVDRSLMQAIWQDQSKELGFDAVQAVAEITGRQPPLPPKAQERNETADREVELSKAVHALAESKKAENAVTLAAEKLAEREAAFAKDDLIKESVLQGFGEVVLRDIEAAIQKATKEKSLIEANIGQEKGFTTPRAMRLEKESIQLMRAGRGAIKPILTKDAAHELLQAGNLNKGQLESATHILSTKDRVIGIQGYAGTGKTYMLTAVREIATLNKVAESKGYVVRGFAPGAAQANILQTEAGIPSTTLARHLADLKKEMAQYHAKSKLERLLFSAPPSHANELWVVDESSMLSNHLMRDLLKAADRTEARVVLVGDIKQLGAVEAGKPFELLQRSGMDVREMKEILRQKDRDTLAAVKHSIDGKARAALEKIKNTVYEIKEKENRLAAIAKHYLSLSLEERARTLVIAPANEDRVKLNDLIREGRTREGSLKGAAANAEIYTRRGLTRVETKQAGSYQPGDVVRFGRDYKSLGVKNGEYVTVTGVDPKSKVVRLKTREGRHIDWIPYKIAGRSQGGVEVYQKEERHLKEGELVRWTRNDNQRDIRNAEIAEVTKVQGNQVAFRLSSGKDITLNVSQEGNRHWDHAYTSTVHAAQGRTTDRVLALVEDFRKFLTNQKSFYVKLSRARYEAHLYTNDKDGLIKAIEERTGEKTSALESTVPRPLRETPVRDTPFLEQQKNQSVELER